MCLGTGNGGFRQIPHGVGDKDGIIIVDHGSRRKESNLMLSKISIISQSFKFFLFGFSKLMLLDQLGLSLKSFAFFFVYQMSL